jgi:hypothetical protein
MFPSDSFYSSNVHRSSRLPGNFTISNPPLALSSSLSSSSSVFSSAAPAFLSLELDFSSFSPSFSSPPLGFSSSSECDHDFSSSVVPSDSLTRLWRDRRQTETTEKWKDLQINNFK